MPLCESLEDTINRVVPYFNNVIKKDMLSGKRVLIVAHGNSIRSLVKYFENLSEEEILEVNIPTGTPLVYEFDDDFRVIEKHYLGDEEEIAKKTNSVLNQGSIKNQGNRDRIIVIGGWEQMKYFIVEGMLKDSSPINDDIMKKHMAYTQKAMDKGLILMSGLKDDMSGGNICYEGRI